jgi:hypothetical protein
MWRKLFGGVDEPLRERIDAVVRIVDSYLFEEAELYGRQSEKQTIHPRELASDKRRALYIGGARHRIIAKLQTRVNSDFVPYSPRAASTGLNWRGACRSSRLASHRHRRPKPDTLGCISIRHHRK